MPSTKVPLPNHNFVPEYQQSGIPFATGSSNLDNNVVDHISLPSVSRWIVFHNLDSSNSSVLRLGFTENGVKGVETNNYFVVHPGEQTPKLELKTKDIFIGNYSGHDNVKYSLIAGLTGIPSRNLPTLTGSLVENGTKILPGVG